MRDIYLIDFENVASEGLSGITYLAPEDQVIIFYSSNSNRLSMKMHILIGKSVCHLDYFEAAVGGKNALDHQISTWLGYLIGTGAAERNYYIVSRDMGYKFVASFWAEHETKPSVRCIENIRVAGRLDRSRAAREAKEEKEVPVLLHAPETPLQLHPAPPQEEPETLDAEGDVQTERPEDQVKSPVKSTRNRQYYRRNRTKPGRGAERTETESHPTDAAQAAASAPEARPAAELKPYKGRAETNPVEEPKAAQEAKPAQEIKPEAADQPEPLPEKPSAKQEAKPDGRRRARSNRPKPESEPRRTVELGQLLSPYPNLQEQQLQQLIADNKRQVLCNTLRKQLGQEKGLALYNEIKKSAWR